MTDTEMRIAIAEWCGWKRGKRKEYSFVNPQIKVEHDSWISPDGFAERRLPDYLNDLNAMHEAEKHLGLDEGRNGQVAQYVANIWRVVADSPEAGIGTIHATARQRAEALLRTLNLFKE